MRICDPTDPLCEESVYPGEPDPREPTRAEILSVGDCYDNTAHKFIKWRHNTNVPLSQEVGGVFAFSEVTLNYCVELDEESPEGDRLAKAGNCDGVSGTAGPPPPETKALAYQQRTLIRGYGGMCLTRQAGLGGDTTIRMMPCLDIDGEQQWSIISPGWDTLDCLRGSVRIASAAEPELCLHASPSDGYATLVDCNEADRWSFMAGPITQAECWPGEERAKRLEVEGEDPEHGARVRIADWPDLPPEERDAWIYSGRRMWSLRTRIVGMDGLPLRFGRRDIAGHETEVWRDHHDDVTPEQIFDLYE